MLVKAAFYSYEERGIGRAAARALYGKILQGSVTRLEQYASCAYAHFLRYGLELMERELALRLTARWPGVVLWPASDLPDYIARS